MYVLTNGAYYYNRTNTNKIVKVLNISEAYKFSNQQEANKELNRATGKLKDYKVKEVFDIQNIEQQQSVNIKTHKRKQFSPTIRKEVYRKSKGHCCLCGNFVDYDDYTVDHIIPLAKGGTNDISNLQCACRVCNNIKTDVLPNEFIDKITEMIIHNIKNNQSNSIRQKIAKKLVMKNISKATKII